MCRFVKFAVEYALSFQNKNELLTRMPDKFTEVVDRPYIHIDKHRLHCRIDKFGCWELIPIVIRFHFRAIAAARDAAASTRDDIGPWRILRSMRCEHLPGVEPQTIAQPDQLFIAE